MAIRVLKSDEGEPAERSGAAIFEGGQVWARTLAGVGTDQLTVTMVQFGAGARAAWHTHSTDQVLYVVSGIGKVGDRDGERVISAGDTVVIPAGVEHWHGAYDTGWPMSHIAIMPAGSQATVLNG
ncbi:MAG: cupin domain-containing protein [Hyphomicrobiales bacterium]